LQLTFVLTKLTFVNPAKTFTYPTTIYIFSTMAEGEGTIYMSGKK